MTKLCDLPIGIYEKALNPKLCIEEKLAAAKNAGYDHMELNIDASPEKIERLYDQNGALKIRNATIEMDVPIYTLALTANRSYPLGSADPAVRNKGIEIIKKAIDFSVVVGIRIIHLAAYDDICENENSSAERLFKEGIAECVDYASKKGVILALETMDTHFMGSIQRVMEYVRMMDSPYLQAYVDIGNVTAMDLDPAATLPAAGRHIVGIHLKDTILNVFRDIPFGQGIVDFERCFETLSKMHYEGFFVVEMWDHGDIDGDQEIRNAYRFLKHKMSNY